jgi:hypothetical protein
VGASRTTGARCATGIGRLFFPGLMELSVMGVRGVCDEKMGARNVTLAVVWIPEEVPSGAEAPLY